MAEAAEDPWAAFRGQPTSQQDDWSAFKQPPAQQDDWSAFKQQDVQQSEPQIHLTPSDFGVPSPSPTGLDLSNGDLAAAVTLSRAGDVWRAFNSRASEVYGDRPLGMSDEDYKTMQDHGWFRKDTSAGGEGLMGVVRAFNELALYQGVSKILDFAQRAPAAVYEGAKAALTEAGVPRDVASLADAFQGSPNFLHTPEPYVKPTEVRPVVENTPTVPGAPPAAPTSAPTASLPRSQAAQTGIPEVDRVLNSPVTKTVIDNAVVDRQFDVPYMAGGSEPLADPTVYIDRHVPLEQTAPSLTDPAKTLTFDPADPWTVHENVEQHTMEMLIKNGMSNAEAYRVAHFEFAERAEQAWYVAHDIDQKAAEAEQQRWLPGIQHKFAGFEEGLSGGSSGQFSYTDLGQFPARPNEPLGREAQDYVVWRGHTTGNEHLVAFDNNGNVAEHGHGGPNRVGMSPEFRAAINNQMNRFVLHHNHPSSTSLSRADIAMLTAPGLKAVWAHGHDGSVARAELTPDARSQILGRNLQLTYRRIFEITQDIDNELYTPLYAAVREGKISTLDAYKAQHDLVNQTLHRAGIINYRSNFDTSKVIDAGGSSLRGAMQAAANDAARRFFVDNSREATTAPDRHTEPLRHVGDLGASFDRSREPTGRYANAGRDATGGSQGAGGETSGGPGLEEEDENRYRPNFPPNLYKKPYPHSHVEGAEHESVEESPPSPEEVARAYSIINNARELDPRDPALPLGPARDLGVIGPKQASIADGTPEQAANGRVPPQQPPKPPGGGPSGQPPSPPLNPWQQRFERFVTKLDAPADVKQLIREAAKENGDFMPARQGDIPLGQVASIAEAAGVEPSEINQRGLGRLLRNDNEARIAMQLMLQTADNMLTAAREVQADGSPENLIKFQEAIMRRDLAAEQVVGLRAEWGRTGNVFQEFLRDVKDQEGLSQFLKDKGRTPNDLKNIADALGSLDRGQAAKFMNDLRKPGAWDKFLFYWTNSLISGPFTHTKYVLANATFGAYEAAIVTPIAGALGAVRSVLSKDAERVYMGETAARMWGLLAGVPDALKASWKAARDNIQTPLPGEIAKNINPVINQKPNPIGGIMGTVIGVPSRGAAGIHSFFNFLGYRAEIEAQAYRVAAKEGLNVTQDQFWQRRADLANAPTDKMMKDAIASGYRLTFIQELGENARNLQRLANMRVESLGGAQPFKLIFPFLHIPLNLLKATYENTPAAFLDKDMRANLTGKNGAVAQDTAVARVLGGSVIMAYVANLALNDRVTGDGPTDPEERKRWVLTHQPNSVRIGDNWVSYQRFGPIGDLLGMSSNLVSVGPQVDEGKYNEAAGHIVKASTRILMDEVGMQGLVNIIEAMEDPDRKGTRYLSSFAGTLAPFSSAMRQSAAYMDPQLRVAKTFVDQLRAGIPMLREGLLPQRDWLGRPLDNPAYHSILRTQNKPYDPIAQEVQALGINPTPPQDRIGGVKLTPELFDEYQATAGPLAQQMLGAVMSSRNWSSLPDVARKDTIEHIIKAARKQAEGAMQVYHPSLIAAGIQQRINQITTGAGRPKQAPQGLQ